MTGSKALKSLKLGYDEVKIRETFLKRLERGFKDPKTDFISLSWVSR
jgi:hypothetical protein